MAEVARADSFSNVGGADLADTSVDYNTTFEIVKQAVAGTTAGVVHMQMRDTAGNPHVCALHPTCEDIFEVSVEGPLALVRLSRPVLMQKALP